MRMRKKKNLLPRMERCEALLVRDPYARRGRWRDLLPGAREVRLELGCGKGRFTKETAQGEPDVLFIAVEMIPEAIVVAMERCLGLSNVYFVSANADQLPSFFAPGEADRIYLNFSDPWPGNRHAKRRLTHGNFLRLYRQVLKPGGEIHFKTDNEPLFDFSLKELPRYGFTLSEVTRDLHRNGPAGVMTDYEAKFYAQGKPIYRLVGTVGPWTEPFPDQIRQVRQAWLEAFAAGVPREVLERRVLAPGNYLWHIFTWGQVPCQTGDAAREALKGKGECYLFYCEYPPAGVSRIQRLASPAECPPEDWSSFDGSDWYLTDKDFTWTYVHTHEGDLGPYYCEGGRANT